MIHDTADHHDIAAIIADSDIVVSERFHAIVVAAILGRPTVGLLYDVKVAELAAQLGIDGRSVDINAPFDPQRSPTPSWTPPQWVPTRACGCACRPTPTAPNSTTTSTTSAGGSPTPPATGPGRPPPPRLRRPHDRTGDRRRCERRAWTRRSCSARLRPTHVRIAIVVGVCYFVASFVIFRDVLVRDPVGAAR